MALQQNLSGWPMLDEYDKALTDAPTTVHDADIRIGKLSYDSRPIRLNGYSGKYASVYKMGDWVVKCFFTNPITSQLVIKPPPDINERYQAINDYVHLHRQQLTFLVPQIWVQRAITIKGQVWPFIKAHFIQAPMLGVFLADMCQEQFVVSALAKQWFDFIDTLESLHIAHGDLDVTNVLIFGTYPHLILRLVDFDSMYVPALHGRVMHEGGHEHFQPPFQLGLRKFDAEMDRFSALVIYLSLIALAKNSRLWEQCKANEETRLLLGSSDFQDLGNSSAYQILRAQQNNWELQLCLDELASSIYHKRMPRSLSAVLNSPPPEKVTTVRLLPQTPPSYIASPIPIPLEFMTSNAQIPTTIPLPLVPSNVQPPLTIPIPTSYLQSPSAAGQAPPPAPITPSGSRTNPAVWWLLACAILTALIAIITWVNDQEQPVWAVILLFMTAILLIIMFVVAGKKNTSQ